MNPSTRALIEALGGDLATGRCCCPAHDDHRPSLDVRDGAKQETVFVCRSAGCSQAEIIDALRSRGLWPIPGSSAACNPTRNTKVYSAAQRRAFALEILRDTEAFGGRWRAPILLAAYFKARGIDHVPPTALVAMDNPEYCDDPVRLVPEWPAIVFPVTDGQEVVGCHVTFLAGFVAARKIDPSEGNPRLTYGPISGGYIQLYEGELDPKSKLVIGEGIENTLSAAQIAGGLPAIAGISATNLPKISPPPAAEYIIAGDNDEPGGPGIPAARALAVKLVRAGHKAKLAIPPRPGSDWNDILLERIQNGKI